MRQIRLILIRLLLILGSWPTSLTADTVGNTDTTTGWFYLFLNGTRLAEYRMPAADLTDDFQADSAAVYCEGSSTSRKLKITLYADNAGVPGDSIGTSPEITTTNGASRTWYKVPVDWNLSAATQYWLGAIADGASNVSKTIQGINYGLWLDTSGSYAAIPADGANAYQSLGEDTLKAACIYLIGTFGGGPAPAVSPRRQLLLTGATK